MAFHVHVTANISGLTRALQDLAPAEHQVAELAKELAEPYVPKKSGALRESARVDGNIVSYNTIYARLQYKAKETPGHPWKHPVGQRYWFLGMQKEHGAELREAAAAAVLEELRRANG